MYRKILIPVVIGANVAPLVRFASYLLDPNGDIVVLHVITAKSMPEVARGWRNSLHTVIPAHEAGAALDVNVLPLVKVAPDAAVEILEQAESERADAIMMVLSGNQNKRRNPFVGSTTAAVLHHASSDVVIVNRLALTMNRVGRVLLPTFTLQPPRKAMTAAEAISQKKGGVPIVTLHLLQGEGAQPEGGDHTFLGPGARGKKKRLKTVLFPSRLFRLSGALPELFLDVAQREGYGLCIVGEERRGLERTLLTRSFIERLFSHAPCPVMVLRG